MFLLLGDGGSGINPRSTALFRLNDNFFTFCKGVR